MGTLNALRGSGSLLLSVSTHHHRRRRHHLHRPLASLLLSASPFATQLRCSSPSPSPSPFSLNNNKSFKCYCTAVSSSSAASIDPPKTEDLGSRSGDKMDDEIDLAKIKEAANTLDLRVGKILKAWRHEEADSLYVEEVDVGEPEPRTICSGLVKYVPLEHLQDKNVVVLANLKPRNMRGVKSYGMLMAASDDSHENVELLMPPEGSVPGERIWFGSIDEKENLPDPVGPNQIQKKKIWELVQPHLRTDDSCIAFLGTENMRTVAGSVFCKSLKNARIS